jgi:hypothetical protein
MKLGMDVLPLEATPDFHFLFSTAGNTNEMDAQIR